MPMFKEVKQVMCPGDPIPGRMRAVVAQAVNDYALKEVDVPTLSAGDILLKVEACGICAGDVKASHGTARFWGGDGMPGFCKPPFIPGHEFVGHIAALGNDPPEGFQVGDRIVSEQIVPCGSCYYCRRGMYWLCEPHDVYGFKNYLNGGMAEYVRLPKGSLNYHIPEELPLEKAVLIEPMACSLHGVNQAQAKHSDVVVLAGAGTLGLGMVNALRIKKVKKLIVLDLNDERLALAKKFGADEIINPKTENALRRVLDSTDGVGCDVYIEATGHPSAVQQGLDMLRKGGTFVEFSVMSGMSTIDWSIIGDAKEITIRGSQLSPHCYEETIRNIVNGDLITDGMVTHKYRLEDWAEAYRMAQSQTALKVILVP